ncbi:unnamed protein product [Soboliphyme baturini]|uniref:Transposase n=1 Tax=Soboliphyme baturini TaxID=241478 RepID=A0A183JAX7_9BILA|nr:unnamed protein product [Soboliphyme baturini]
MTSLQQGEQRRDWLVGSAAIWHGLRSFIVRNTKESAGRRAGGVHGGFLRATRHNVVPAHTCRLDIWRRMTVGSPRVDVHIKGQPTTATQANKKLHPLQRRTICRWSAASRNHTRWTRRRSHNRTSLGGRLCCRVEPVVSSLCYPSVYRRRYR